MNTPSLVHCFLTAGNSAESPYPLRKRISRPLFMSHIESVCSIPPPCSSRKEIAGHSFFRLLDTEKRKRYIPTIVLVLSKFANRRDLWW